ncbi:hypothetical protein [Streptomyces sp. NPDC001205]
MTIPFTPQGTDPKTGKAAWHTADFEDYEHRLETEGAWTPAPTDRPIVLGRHSLLGIDSTVVVTDVATREELAARRDKAAADSPEVRLLLDGDLAWSKASSAALNALAARAQLQKT